MKKAQMLRFLFYTILALVIFVPTGLWASQFFKLSDNNVQSFNELSRIIDSIRDGEIQSMPLHLNQENFIVGFTKESEKSEAYLVDDSSVVGYLFSLVSDEVNGYFERPVQCSKGESCACLCRNGLKFDGSEIICSGSLTCNKFDSIDFFERRSLHDLPLMNGNPEDRVWKGGFFISNPRYNAMAEKVYAASRNNLNIKSPLPVYVERYENYVAVCLDSNCITNNMIDRINKEQAIKEFNNFKRSFLACRESGDNCDSINLDLPQRYFIFYRPILQEEIGIFDINYYYSDLAVLSLVNTEKKNSGYVKSNLDDLTVKDEDGNEYFVEGKIRYSDIFLPNSFSMEKENGAVHINPSK